MTEKDRELRDRAEAIVLRGLKAADAVREAGRALHMLKSKDLWRDSHDSWQEYVQERFQITPRRAHQLVEFSSFTDAVAEQVGTTVPVTLTERALRPLSDVPPEQVGDAIAEAIAESGGGEPTPAAIRKAASKRKVSKGKKTKAPKAVTIRVAGAKVTIVPTHPEPIFRGWQETLVAALEKVSTDRREAA
jgi:hypothetical protein